MLSSSALFRGKPSHTASDTACALHRDVQTSQRILAERTTDRSLQAEENTERRMRPGIAADFAAGNGQARHVARLRGNCGHVGDRHADIFGGDVIAAQLLDGLAECGDLLRCLGTIRIGEDDSLSAAERKAGHGIFKAHPAR